MHMLLGAASPKTKSHVYDIKYGSRWKKVNNGVLCVLSPHPAKNVKEAHSRSTIATKGPIGPLLRTVTSAC